MYLAELQFNVFQNECVRLIRIILECEGLLRDFRVVARFGKSRRAHMPALIAARRGLIRSLRRRVCEAPPASYTRR